MSLPREVLKWVQSLDLSHSITKPKRDVANAVIIAEILSRYVSDVPLHGLDSSSSIARKTDNWRQLEKSFTRAKVQLPKDVIDGAIQCRDGCAVEVLKAMYSQLTGRQIQSLPPLQAEEADISNIPKIPKMKIAKDMGLMTAPPEPLMEVAAQPAQSALKKTPAPDAQPKSVKSPIKPKAVVNTKMQTIKPPMEGRPETPTSVAFSQVTLRAVELSSLHGSRAASIMGDTPARRGGGGGGAKNEGDVFLFLAQCVQDSFRRTGLYNDVSHGERCFQILVDPESTYARNVVDTAWGTIFSYSRRLVDIIQSNDAEMMKLVAALNFVWETEFNKIHPIHGEWNIHCEKGRLLLGMVGEDLSTRDAQHAFDMLMEHILPPCIEPLRICSGPVRHNICRLIASFLSNASLDSKLAFLKALPEKMCVQPLQENSTKHRIRNLSAFYAALAVFSGTDQLGVTADTNLANTYSYYATLALHGTSSLSQASGLVMLEKVLAAGYVEVAQQVGALHELALFTAGGGVHWEVSAHLVLTIRTILEISPCDEAYDIAQVLLSVPGNDYLRAFTMCNLAPFVIEDKPEMSAQFFESFFAYPQTRRLALMQGTDSFGLPPTLMCSESFDFPPMLSWEVPAAVSSVVELMSMRRVPMKEALQVLEVIIRNCPNVAELHGFWMNFVIKTQDDFCKALAIRGHPPGLVDAETKELCYQIAKKLFVELSGINVQTEDSTMVQKKVMDWYRAVLQHSL
eukprot:PhF_6_TR36541/c0_g1_i1/m.53889